MREIGFIEASDPMNVSPILAKESRGNYPIMLKKLIKELLTNNSNNGVLEELNPTNYFHLSNMIDQAEAKRVKPSYGKNGANALVKEEIRKQTETKFSDFVSGNKCVLSFPAPHYCARWTFLNNKSSLYAWDWLENLNKEKWTKQLIGEFVEPFSSPSLDDEDECFRGNGVSRPKKVSLQDASYLGRQNYDDEYEKSVSPISSKCNYFGGGKGKEHKIYVREFNSHVRKEQPVNSTVEGGIYTDTKVVPFECCPNKERIRSLLPYLGKLRRNGTLAGHAWTKEEPKTPCRLVVPDIQCVRERISKTMSPVPEGEEQDEYREVSNNSRNPLMIVEMIANKLDRKRVADRPVWGLDFDGSIIKSNEVVINTNDM
ncbi:2596_t:CDS:2 [Funneliformis mosseae]|uniref:2596_t:CDS:1 n=1 Tax=Funneliformis mosseae TaxID=27381 RepID=A0A9N9D7W3_FUNMO|nr:2596_t:CDS:2 [Funneliformis mosseae]